MKLKICGVQSVEEAQRLAEIGVDFIGLNFVPASSRRISLATGEKIADSLRNNSIKIVALFQDQPLNVVRQYAQELKPHFVQLHGQESADYISGLDVAVIKAITFNQTPPKNAVYYLLDRIDRGRGPIVDLDVAAEIVDRYPDRVFLAGGLTSENLSDILTRVQPFGIDIAGGVRTDNVLDFGKVEKVLEIVRSQL